MPLTSLCVPLTGVRPALATDHKATLAQGRLPAARRVYAIAQASANPIHTPNESETSSTPLSRRTALTAVTAAAFSLTMKPSPASGDAEEPSPTSSSAPSISVVSTEAGSGTVPAQIGDLVLIHYVGTLPDGTVFDSTKGGLKYRDGGEGVFRPVAVKLGGDPVPGICAGLTAAVVGLRVGGRATVEVPPELGFGSVPVLAPYGVVPGGSRLRYDVELVRLSRRGPDALMQGVTQCGNGFVNERTAGCGEISVAEFV